DLGLVPNSCQRADDLLFSESHSRYLIGTRDPEKVIAILSLEGVPFAHIGTAAGSTVEIPKARKKMIMMPLKSIHASFYSLEKIMQ
ncbi:MAG: phosphoribosylformylglycinamidine synthase subunit PurL, partial [Nitrososphaera sp.]|nr:phosphoribosylformylglycinamidine synthase subunit PurL [Nitrososphaera sp.]